MVQLRSTDPRSQVIRTSVSSLYLETQDAHTGVVFSLVLPDDIHEVPDGGSGSGVAGEFSVCLVSTRANLSQAVTLAYALQGASSAVAEAANSEATTLQAASRATPQTVWTSWAALMSSTKAESEAASSSSSTLTSHTKAPADQA